MTADLRDLGLRDQITVLWPEIPQGQPKRRCQHDEPFHECGECRYEAQRKSKRRAEAAPGLGREG